MRLTGSGHWAMAGGRPSRLDSGKAGHARQGKARQGQARHSMAGTALGAGHWARAGVEGGGEAAERQERAGPGTAAKTVHRPHANQNRLDPPDGEGPREEQGGPLLGMYQQLSGPERLREERDSAHAGRAVDNARTVKFHPARPNQPARRPRTRADPQFETQRETRYPSWPRHSPSLNPVPGFLS